MVDKNPGRTAEEEQTRSGQKDGPPNEQDRTRGAREGEPNQDSALPGREDGAGGQTGGSAP